METEETFSKKLYQHQVKGISIVFNHILGKLKHLGKGWILLIIDLRNTNPWGRNHQYTSTHPSSLPPNSKFIIFVFVTGSKMHVVGFAVMCAKIVWDK